MPNCEGKYRLMGFEIQSTKGIVGSSSRYLARLKVECQTKCPKTGDICPANGQVYFAYRGSFNKQVALDLALLDSTFEISSKCLEFRSIAPQTTT